MSNMNHQIPSSVNGIVSADGSVASSANSNTKVQSSSKARKSTSLPAETVEYLKAWMMSPEHISHPYPTEQEKAKIMADTGIELKQLTNWFVNNRKRYWKPRVEARLQQQAQAQNAAAAAAVLASRRVTSTANAAGFEFLGNNGGQVILQPNTGHIIALDIGQPGNAGSQQQPQQILPSPVVSAQIAGHQIHIHNAANLVLPSQHNLLPHFQQSTLSNSNNDSRSLFPNLQVNDSLSHLIMNSTIQNSNTRSPTQTQTSTQAHFVRTSSPSIIYDDSDSKTVSSSSEESKSPAFTPISQQETGQQEIEPNDKINTETRMVMRREVVDVHILRPTLTTIGDESNLPTIKDVTILSNVPRDRIIKSYNNCEISYSFPLHIINERKKVQRRRDAEVVRIKKHYLKLFLTDQSSTVVNTYQAQTPASTPIYSAEVSVTESDDEGINSDLLCESSTEVSPNIRTPLIQNGPVRKRSFETTSEARYIEPDDDSVESPSKRIKTLLEAASSEAMVSVSHWRDACRKAKHYSDAGLPSLEEAARMFGYTN